MGDPYAEFGGQQQSTPPAVSGASDPYAEFGGQAVQQAAPPPSASSRFWAGVKHGMGDNSDISSAQLNSGSFRHPNFANNPMIPGSGVYRDITAGNYAGAAGRVLGPAAVLLSMLPGGRAEPPSPAAMQLERTLAADSARAALPRFPNRAEGLPEIEAMQPQATAKLQQAIQPKSLPAGEPETNPVQVGSLPRESGNPYGGPRTPQMERLDSTNLQKAGYHESSQTMVIEFRNGRVYEYRGVPKEIYKQFQDSESQGSFFARNIKGRYQTNYRGSVLGRKY